MAQILQSLGALDCPVLVSTIVEPGPKLAALTGTDGVFDYVAAIQRVCALNGGGAVFVSYSADLVEDGHHLTRKGHQRFSREVLKILRGALPRI